MADVAESSSFTDPATAISQGRRHLLVRDYSSAVSALSQACDLLAQKHGDTSDELGEAYLLYGRALLGLAREEAGVLGEGVPGTDEAQANEEDDDEDEDEEEDEEEDEDDDDADNNEKNVKNREEKRLVKSGNDDVSTEKKAEKKEQTPAAKETSKDSGGQSIQSDSNKTDDNKIAEQKAQISSSAAAASATTASVSNSNKQAHVNGEASSSTSTHNGGLRDNGDDDTEDLGKEDEDDGANNLQVAWEVLELAKLVLLKRGPPGWKLLAESYRLLGEVAMEGGNHQGALTDLQGCLNLLEKIEPLEPRALAEIHYQLGLAHSLANDFDASIEQFNKATNLLEARIKELEETSDPPKSDDPFYSVEGEIQELKDLLPEIQEKIADMRDFKQEACKLVIEGIKNRVASGCSNGAGPSNISNGSHGNTGKDATTASSSSSSSSGGGGSTGESSKQQKPATDISHLVRKKRKADETETDSSQVLKKPTPEKAA